VILSMIKCSECGYENMDGLDYCDGCGAKLESAAHAGGGEAHPSTPPAGSAAAAPDPAAVNEMAAAGAPATAAESPTTAAASPQPAAESAMSGTPEAGASNEHVAAVPEPPLAKAPTGEMSSGVAAPASAPEPAAAPFKAKLSIIRGGRRGQEFELESGNNLVGRWDPETGAFPEVDLDADDPEAKVSRKHALIRIDGGKITIEDIGSLNGTYVNRQPRLQPGTPQDLKDGDEIIIGKTFLKLSINPIS
jgi:hypothetical protein